MKKVLLVANTDWYLYRFRLSFAKYLAAKGYEVVLVSPATGFSDLLQRAGFRWVEWKLGRRTLAPWLELKSLLDLVHIYQEEKPDLVHHFTIKCVLYGSLAVRWAHVANQVNSITGLGFVFLNNQAWVRLLRQVIILLYRYFLQYGRGAVIFENLIDRDVFIQLGIVRADQSYIVPGVGVDPDAFQPAPEPPGTPLILLPARMLWDKGVGTFADAARQLRQKYAARFVLAGSLDLGNPSAIDEGTIKAWQDEHILEWWGFQSDMCSLYQKSHVIVLPSMREGLPTTLIEAAACGKAIVATDVPGCRDVVQDQVNGILVPPSDPQALAEAIERLMVDPALRDQYGTAGRRIALERFTADLINQMTFEVYQELIKRNGQRVEAAV